MRLSLLFSLSGFAFAATLPSTFSFEPNRGQTDPSIQYLARTASGFVFFTGTELVLHRPGGDTLRFEFVGSDPKAAWQGSEPLDQTISYRIGRDKTKWADNVPRYSRLTRPNIYPGINIVYYRSQGDLEYDFVLAPHADPSRIRIQLSGVHEFSIDARGDLVVPTSTGTVRQRKPILYQEVKGVRTPIEGRFRKLGPRTVGFEVAQYDRNISLSIDPVLEFSTYFGGDGDDTVIAADGNRAVGMTTSLGFPGAPAGGRRGTDIFVSGVPLGQGNPFTTLVLGGSGTDQVTSAAFAAAYTGSIVIGGYTDSQDLPVANQISPSYSGSFYQPNFAGGATDGFLLVLQSDNRGGSSLFFTYLGTSGDDKITAVGINSGGYNVYLAGTTTGSGLLSPDVAPIQAGPGGGLDAFLIVAVIEQQFISPNRTFVFGGSGDDRPLAIAFGNNSFYVAGETTSGDFPLAGSSGQLNGPSDAFLVNIRGSSIIGGSLIGGSGTDRATALAIIGNGMVGVAGVTASQDLPVSNAVQPAYGGGDSDAFYSVFTPDLSRIVTATYIGGSGVDEATALAADYYGNIFLGGRTSSLDFPVKNAIQPAFGGGVDDGFLVHFDIDLSLAQATYFGGSGSDRVLTLFAPCGPTVVLAGVTSSADLPLANATQSALKGNSDGFIARVSTNLISIPPLAGAKDLRWETGFAVAALPSGTSPTFQITSSDPSTVLLSANQTDAGQASISISPSGATGDYFYFDCLSDSGGADLTITSAGYIDRIVHVSCYPARVFFSYSATQVKTISSSPLVLQTTPWLGTIKINLSLGVDLPANTTQAIAFQSGLRPGASPISVQISNSNSTAGSASPSQVTFAGAANGQTVSFQPLTEGQTDISFSSDRALAPDHVSINVISALSQDLSSYLIAAGFQLSPFFNLGSAPTTTLITITSQDPASLVIAPDQKTPGAASLALPYSSPSSINFALQALVAGAQVPITISAPGMTPFTTTVQTGNPVALFNFGSNSSAAPSAPITVGLNEIFVVNSSVTADGTPLTFSPNPGTATPQFGVTAGDPTFLKIAPLSSSAFTVQGIGDGSTTLTAQPPPGMPLAKNSASSVVVNVVRKPLMLKDLTLGKDLQAAMTVTLPAGVTTGTPMTVTSSDPTLVLVAAITSPVLPGQASIVGASNGTFFSFDVQGLKAAGQAKITVQAGSYGSVTATVTLAPSGFAWNSDTYTAVLFNQPNFVMSVFSYVLDPATLTPFSSQAVRAGIDVSGTIQNSNPAVVSLNTLTFPTATLFLTSRAVGSAVLTFAQPNGFSTPSSRQKLLVTITTPSLGLNTTGTIGKDTQASTNLTLPGGVSQPVTFSSSDPSKVLISADNTTPGSGTLTVPNGHGGMAIYLQALDSSGTVTITASSANYLSATLPVTLAPLGVAIGIYNSGNPTATLGTDGTYSTTTISGISNISLYLYVVDPKSGQIVGSGTVPRPGVSPWPIEVRSSNPAVGAITGSPVALTGGQGGVNVAFKPVSIGQTDITIVQPPGFVAPVQFSNGSANPTDASRLTLHVIAPSLVTINTLLAKDTIAFPSIGLQDIAATPSSNVKVTLTSTDPSKLLLSLSADSAPGASITATIVAGQRGTGVLIAHALANSGIVPVTISAPGFADSSFNVALTDLAFSLGASNVGASVRVPLQAGPQKIQVIAAPVSIPNLSNYGSYGVVIRPGAADIPVAINSSNSNVIAVDTPQVVFHAGDSVAFAMYHPVSPGRTTLSLTAPPGYLADLLHNQGNFTVDGAKLSIPSVVSVGKDMQTSIQFQSEVPFLKPTSITVSSSDPGSVLVASDANTPGQASVTFTAQPNQFVFFFVQALRDSSSAPIVVSSDGYQPATTTVNLLPSAAVFSDLQTTLNTFAGTKIHLSVGLVTLDPITYSPNSYFYTQPPRPGANVQIAVTSSDNTIVQPLANLLTIPIQNTAGFDVITKGVGTAILSLSTVAGEPAAASGRQMVVNSQPPSLSLPNITLGKDLMTPLQVTLSSSVPVSQFDTTVFVSTSDNTLIGLSTTPTANGQGSINVVIPKGQRISSIFYVQAFTSSGIAALQISGGSYQASGSLVTLAQTAFIFKEAAQTQPVSIPSGSITTFTLIPAVLPLGTTLPGSLAMRPNFGQIGISISSSNPGAAAIQSPTAYFFGGDQQSFVQVKGLSSGSAKLTITGAPYVLDSAQSTLNVVVP